MSNEAKLIMRGVLFDAGLLIGSASLALSLLLLATRQAVMRAEIEHYVQERTQKRWTSDDTLAWLAEFSELNPGIKMPDIYKIRPDLRPVEEK